MVPLLSLLILVVSCYGQQVILTPGAFLKLNDTRTVGAQSFGNGAATQAAYDQQTRLLYVIGTRGDVMNIISLSAPETPVVVRTVTFDEAIEGYPDAVALCRGGPSRNFLAVSFEKLGTSSRSFVKMFRLLDSPVDSLEILHSRITLDGYDPTGMAFSADCGRLVVIQQGRVHKISNIFDDPEPYVDIIDVSGGSIGKTAIPIIEANLAAAGVRHVLHRCTNDATIPASTAKDDLEPRYIVGDRNDVFYISFPKNNALARLDLNAAPLALEYISAGLKDWRGFGLDTVNDDQITLNSYPVYTFFQPHGIAVFYHNGAPYLVSADAGELTSLTAVDDGCQFSDAASGLQWITTEFFGGEISQEDRAALRTAMESPGQLGNFQVTKQRYPTDGYDSNTQGFNRVTGFGGRGISLLNPSTAQRVDFTSNYFESVFSSQSETTQAVYNADVGSSSSTPSSRMDNTSPSTGPTPRAVAAGEIGGQQVVVTANGHVGGLYAFPIDRNSAEPIINKAGAAFFRRGNPGLSWADLYKNPDDSVGEPETKQILWIDDPNGSSTYAYIAVLANQAGAVSFYRVSLTGLDV